MKKSLLLSLTVLASLGFAGSVVAQAPATRGALDGSEFQATQKSIELQLIVDEIEDAGFELDVLEGFEEEWEEEIWVDAASDDEMDANYIDPSESERFDVEQGLVTEEITDEWDENAWEDPDAAIAAVDEFVEETELEEDEVAMRGEEMEEEFGIEIDPSLETELNLEEEVETVELNWWESETDWQDVIDEMDFEDEFDGEEDLDFLEELYEMS